MSRREYAIQQGLIPDGYTQVEYIRSSGTQWIDTGTTCTNETASLVDMELESNSAKPYPLACYHNGTATRGYLLGCETPSIAYGYGKVQFVNTRITFPINERHSFETTFTNGSQTLKIDGVQRYSTSLSGTWDSIYNLSLFGLVYVYGISQQAKMKLWACKIWKGGVLTRDYIPVVRNSDSKPGLWDTVTQSFFVNQAGGADFTYQTL